MRRQPTFLYLSAKVLSTIIEDNILHLPFKTLSPFLRGGHPSYAKISPCRKRFCGRLTTQGMRRSNQAGGAEHFSGWGLKMTWNGDVEKWEDWGVAKFQPLALPSLQRGGGGGGGGGEQPYFHFSVEKTLGIGLSTGIELVTSFHSPVWLCSSYGS